MKKCLTFVALACVGMMTSASASADSIPGTFFPVNSSNTELQAGGAFSTEFGFSGLWSDRSGIFSGSTADIHQLDGNGNSGDGSGGGGGGFLAAGDDGSIVTTISGLAAGNYEVRFIYSSMFNANDIQYATGFTAAGTTQIQDALNDGNGGFQGGSAPFAERYDDVGFANPTGLSVNGSLIGTTTVTAGGDLLIYTDNLDVFQGQQNALQGFSVVPAAVPEPSSLAVLGLVGGLGLLRRRR